jgi:hypothetical protein
MRSRSVTRFAALALAATAALATSTSTIAAGVDVYDGAWHYDFTLYAWFPGINGTFTLPLMREFIIATNSATNTISVAPDDYLGNLQFGALLAGEARKGNAAIFTDLLYMDLANLKSTVREVSGPFASVSIPANADVNMGVRATVWTLAGSYTVARGSVGTVDLLGGFRYGGLKSSLDVNFSGANPLHAHPALPIGILPKSGTTSDSVNLYDGIVGVRGTVALGDDGKWYVPYYADIGAGNSNWTWQAYTGVGYRFDWGSVVLGFRNLSYDMSAGKLAQNVSMTGPLLAFNWRW